MKMTAVNVNLQGETIKKGLVFDEKKKKRK